MKICSLQLQHPLTRTEAIAGQHRRARAGHLLNKLQAFRAGLRTKARLHSMPADGRNANLDHCQDDSPINLRTHARCVGALRYVLSSHQCRRASRALSTQNLRNIGAPDGVIEPSKFSQCICVRLRLGFERQPRLRSSRCFAEVWRAQPQLILRMPVPSEASARPCAPGP